MVDIQSATAENRRRKNEERRNDRTEIEWPALSGSHNKRYIRLWFHGPTTNRLEYINCYSAGWSSSSCRLILFIGHLQSVCAPAATLRTWLIDYSGGACRVRTVVIRLLQLLTLHVQLHQVQ